MATNGVAEASHEQVNDESIEMASWSSRPCRQWQVRPHIYSSERAKTWATHTSPVQVSHITGSTIWNLSPAATGSTGLGTRPFQTISGSN